MGFPSCSCLVPPFGSFEAIHQNDKVREMAERTQVMHFLAERSESAHFWCTIAIKVIALHSAFQFGFFLRRNFINKELAKSYRHYTLGNQILLQKVGRHFPWDAFGSSTMLSGLSIQTGKTYWARILGRHNDSTELQTLAA